MVRPSSLFAEDDEERIEVPESWESEIMQELFNKSTLPSEPESGPVVHVRATFTHAQALAEAQKLAERNLRPHEPQLTLRDQIPVQYHEFLKVFDKKTSERLPARGEWDHAIDLKMSFEPRPCKTYPLAPVEQRELDKFLTENLEKGYIRPSKSPMASPFFFIKKKDGSL